MAEDLTPEHLKCGWGTCPSVHRIVIDGKRHLIVVGKLSQFEAKELGIEWSAGEVPILIEEDLLSGIGCQAEVTAVGERSSPSALQLNDTAEALARLERALCNFCNGASDEFLPSVWREETKRNFQALCSAYNQAYSSNVFQRPIEEAGLPADERTAETADASLTAQIEKLRAALKFYADPENYHAILIMGDPPCGGFADDFGSDHGHPDYDRPMPGQRARSALTSPEACDAVSDAQGEPPAAEEASGATRRRQRGFRPSVSQRRRF